MRFTRAIVGACLATASVLASGIAVYAQTPSAAESPARLPASRLETAKTVRALGTFSVYGREGKATPFFGVTVTVEKPDRVRIDAAPLAGQAKATSFYLSDGTTQYEYNSLQGKYRSQAAPKPGQRPFSQLHAMAGLSLIREPGAPPSEPGAKRTLTRGTLNDTPAVIATDLSPEKNGRAVFIRAWYDEKTGLPLRRIEGSITVADRAEHPNLQMDYTGWTFDETPPSGTFVWAVPKDAVEDKGPALLARGVVAPDFTAFTPDGKPVKLSDFKGKVVILDFWATWCGPCQVSMPHLEKVYRQVKTQDVVVLAVCVWDQKAEYDKWVAAKKGTYTFLTAFDPAGRGANNIAKALYKVEGIPTQYIIDREGKIAAGTVGYDEKSRFLETTLTRLGVMVPTETAAIP
jgi:thiol-disulfide isomerase/thioredoxin/outer membrane lipoprotein-sorting protein